MSTNISTTSLIETSQLVDNITGSVSLYLSSNFSVNFATSFAKINSLSGFPVPQTSKSLSKFFDIYILWISIGITCPCSKEKLSPGPKILVGITQK